ncbi:MAG: VOC family protein [Bacteroidota bacterium]|nr:VOC family protein [Bacteroidota bacterium]MDP4229920.1 VOC family protein [Bacteroidota bacterium]MDP4235590.1 VOC family protein [Bacteroidota bacterium]
MRMHILSLDHVQLAMPSGGESEARRFYCDILGFEEIPKPEPLRSRGGCWFRSAQAELHLGIEEDFRPAKKAHPAFRTGDIDVLEKHLTAKGFVITPDTALPKVRRFYISDPFGNRIEILE